jgi:hypothetical protein
MTGTIETVQILTPLRRAGCILDFDARILREFAQPVHDLPLSDGPLEARERTRNPTDFAAAPSILEDA